jgi:hypothetical protein
VRSDESVRDWGKTEMTRCGASLGKPALRG